ncbi:hypothetical protein Y032_0202g1759, partial [Ancylostoma ceylanicum]
KIWKNSEAHKQGGEADKCMIAYERGPNYATYHH